MAATTADVKRDIELTRERMSSTLDQLENKLNVVQVIKDHPWPAIALAIGAGFDSGGHVRKPCGDRGGVTGLSHGSCRLMVP